MLKKIVTIMFSAVLVLTLAACGSTGKADKNAAAAPATKPAAKAPVNNAKKSKTLVVYYSASGNTKQVADIIAGATGGATFELKPAQPYSSADLNYNDSSSRVSREHNDKNRAVKLASTAVPDWQSYDTVFIGYPIWWGIAAWPVDDFVKNNDFTGKKVIPFATAASSGLGDSGKLLEKMGKKGTWVAGKCFHGTNKSEIESWVKGLGL